MVFDGSMYMSMQDETAVSLPVACSIQNSFWTINTLLTKSCHNLVRCQHHQPAIQIRKDARFEAVNQGSLFRIYKATALYFEYVDRNSYAVIRRTPPANDLRPRTHNCHQLTGSC